MRNSCRLFQQKDLIIKYNRHTDYRTELGQMSVGEQERTLKSFHNNNDETRQGAKVSHGITKFYKKPLPIFISSSFSFPKAYKSFIPAKKPCCRRCQNLTGDRLEYFHLASLVVGEAMKTVSCVSL